MATFLASDESEWITGTAMIVDGILEPMELGHLPYKKGRTYEDYLGRSGLERRGRRKWRRTLFKVAERLKAALEAAGTTVARGRFGNASCSISRVTASTATSRSSRRRCSTQRSNSPHPEM